MNRDWVGSAVVLVAIGVFVYKEAFYRPPRPSTVPEDAQPFKQGEASLWWWASCRELDAATYNCRLFDDRSALAVAGRFTAQARNYTDDDAEHQGYCRPGAGRLRFQGYYNGEIYAHAGCRLVPRDWTYFPSRGMKAGVSPAPAPGPPSLAPEVPMTEEDSKAYAK